MSPIYDSPALPIKPCRRLPLWVPCPFWVPNDMHMLTGRFMRKAEEYMQLPGPLDCAKWYRLGINEQSSEGVAPKGH